MNKVIVMADSTCDLSKELVEKYDVKIVPLHVTFPNNNLDFLDGIDIDPEKLYKKVDELKTTPKTSAINVKEFIDYFTPYINNGYDIIFTGIGSGLSSTIQNANIAKQEFEEGRIEVVDSQNLSTGTGLLVLKMCELRDQGLSNKDIASKVKEYVPYVSAKFCINELDYLYKGGRCSGFTKGLAGLFHLHPVAMVKDGKLSMHKIIRGKYVKSVDYQIDMFKNDLPNIDLNHVFITDSGHMDGEDKYIEEKLLQYVKKENIHHTKAGCVVCSHCGPKTIGILYINKK